jgi:hypothetical protein
MLPPAVPIVANRDKETVEVILNYLYTLLFYLGDLQLVTPDEMTAAINAALIDYATVPDVQDMIDTSLTAYSTTTQMNTAITNAITSALTAYSTTVQMNTAIIAALTPYSTTAQMNTAINTALTPYSTTAQVQAMITAAIAHITITGSVFDGGRIVP